MRKEKILKLTLNWLIKNRAEDLGIHDIVILTGLSANRLGQIFPYGSNEILMDTIEYAGKVWLQEVRFKVQQEKDVNNKLRILAAGYALGSENYPEVLSIYIDLWKMIKDKEEEYIRKRLKEIYQKYMQEFMEIGKEIGHDLLSERELAAWAVILTTLSDALHIQSVTLDHNLDFTAIRQVIEKCVLLYFFHEA